MVVRWSIYFEWLKPFLFDMVIFQFAKSQSHASSLAALQVSFDEIMIHLDVNKDGKAFR